MKTHRSARVALRRNLAPRCVASLLLAAISPFASAAPGGSEGAGLPSPPGCTRHEVALGIADAPVPILDLQTASLTLTVFGAPTYLDSVAVVTYIAHPRNGHLDVTVTSPAGTEVTLTTDNGGTFGNAFAHTEWRDDAGQLATASYDGTIETQLVPEEAMGAFRGEDPNGTWRIDVFDDAAGFEGTLVGWELHLVTLDAAPVDVLTVFPSIDTPLPILDFEVVSSSLPVSGLGGFVCDVDLTTVIDHPTEGELSVWLSAPGSPSITVTDARPFGDFQDLTFWDDDAGDLNPPGPVTDLELGEPQSPVAIEEAFGALHGVNPNGAWLLEVYDNWFGPDDPLGGQVLNSWALHVTTCSCGASEADLAIQKTGALGPSGTVVYTLAVTNGGPADATGVVVTDSLPACMGFVGSDCGAVDTPPLTWALGNLADGAAAVCNVTIDASACTGTVVNSAAVAGDQTDPVAANDSSTSTVLLGGVLEIPTLDESGLALLLLALAAAAVAMLRRRPA